MNGIPGTSKITLIIDGDSMWSILRTDIFPKTPSEATEKNQPHYQPSCTFLWVSCLGGVGATVKSATTRRDLCEVWGGCVGGRHLPLGTARQSRPTTQPVALPHPLP
ncbi:hypothetical protein E2C01_082350 [Portunus trituberculatus]|uniref:Uncharacterized protein n=1 Tax=Portunus trituberculatus TaxID=210409 RepID=A0A5B7J3L0_PORTR|nr:hypothetical protein [Portunus trituberculatus]